MKIYTKTGDKGETGLVGGLRVSKADVRLEAYGDVDELNSHIGLVFSLLNKEEKFRQDADVLRSIQNILFTLGSNLASEKESREKFKIPKIPEKSAAMLEEKMDLYDKDLPPLKNFILPNGSELAARAHVARTVCRRVERKLVSFSVQYPKDLPENAIKFLNRLSDFLFVFSRHINRLAGEKETIWTPGD